MRHPYASFVHEVERPARYLGGEYMSIAKDPASVDAQVVLAFPDVYEIGMSHLGTKILYSLLNKHDRILCERAFTHVDLPLRWQGAGIAEQGIGADGRVLVEIDPRYLRPTEVDAMQGDAGKARRELGWQPTVRFEQLVAMMVEADLKR